MLFTSLMLINDPVTSPSGPVLAIIYGFIGGIISMLLRYFGNIYDSSVFAVLIMNCIWPAFTGETVSNKLMKVSKKQKAAKTTLCVSEKEKGGEK